MKNIFFDLGRTLVRHPEDGMGDAIIRKRGICDEEDIRLVKSLVFDVNKYVNFLDEGSMPREVYINNILKEAPRYLHEQILDVIHYHITELAVIDGIVPLLERLKAQGCKLFITSNLDAFHAAQMYETELATYFDGLIFSSEIKVRKPHRAFFEKACERFKVAPEDCLFIDDLADNVAAAEAHGIKSFLFQGDVAAAEWFIHENSFS